MMCLFSFKYFSWFSLLLHSKMQKKKNKKNAHCAKSYFQRWPYLRQAAAGEKDDEGSFLASFNRSVRLFGILYDVAFIALKYDEAQRRNYYHYRSLDVDSPPEKKNAWPRKSLRNQLKMFLMLGK